MNRASVVLIVAAISITVLLVVKLRSSRPASLSVRGRPVTLKGQMAPDLALESLDGRTVHLSNFRGKAILLNFWATWCVPCRYEMPLFEQMQEEYGPQGLEVLGITVHDTSEKKDIAEFASNLGIDYPILLGTESVGEAYECVRSVPVTIYVGRDGKIVEKVFGLTGRDEIEGNIRKALSRRQ